MNKHVWVFLLADWDQSVTATVIIPYNVRDVYPESSNKHIHKTAAHWVWNGGYKY